MSPLLTASIVAPALVGAIACLAVAVRAPEQRRSTRLRERLDAHLREDLALLGLDVDTVFTRVVLSAMVIGLSVGASLLLVIASGVAPVPMWWLALVVPAAAAGAAVVVIGDVRTRAARRREALHRAANDLVQLLAVGLTTDQSVDEALHVAVRSGRTPEHELLRDVVLHAPVRGMTAWEVLDELGHRYGLRELTELATSLEQQGVHGVSIADTVGSLARSMRERTLDQLERDADRANQNLAGPTVAFVVTTLVFLAFPLGVRISTAFGGG